MSFPRAKLTRFNEIQPTTPSPADYYIPANNNTVNIKISKSERFQDKSPAPSDNGSAISVSSTPLFRTPTLPKKKKGIFSSLSSRKVKSIDLSDPLHDLEALKDKIVECHNKDSYIKDLTEQIEEMKERLSAVERQRSALHDEKARCEEAARDLEEGHRVVLENVYKQHDAEVSGLKSQLDAIELKELDTTMQFELEETSQLLAEQEKLREGLEQRLSQLELEHAKLVESLKLEHKSELTELEHAMVQSVAELQTRLDKEKAACKERIEEMQERFESEKSRLLEETDARIKQVEEDSKEANLLAEIQLQEKCRDLESTWKLKLAEQDKLSEDILKECQAISEYSIITCEVEKNAIKSQLVEKLEEIECQQRTNADLQIAHKELDLKCRDIQEMLEATKGEVENFRASAEMENRELQDALSQKKMYEISIQKSHETIDTLMKRLLDSDHDVEQLKDELETCELSKLEYQGKCNQLMEELEVVGTINEDLEGQYEVTISNTEARIQALERELLQKVEDNRLQAEVEISQLSQRLQEKDCDLTEVLDQLHDQQALNADAQDLIAKAQATMGDLNVADEHRNLEMCRMKSDFVKNQNQLEELEETIEQLQNENKDLLQKLDGLQEENVNLRDGVCGVQQVEGLVKQIVQLQEKAESYSQYCDYYKVKAAEYEGEVEELEGVNKKYIEQSGRFDDLLQKYEALEKKNSALEKKVAEQETLIGPFREQLEAYEMEHKVLISQKSQAENEARDMGLKYAQLLGHQNQRQKIKHLIDLKAKNFELNESKKDMEVKLRSQTRTIEKLKKELLMLSKSPRKTSRMQDKENISSPNRTLNSSRVESPGPLRDRN